MEQDLHSEDSKPTHRNFQLKIIDAHHVDATDGNVLRLRQYQVPVNKLLRAQVLQQLGGHPGP